MSKTVKNMARLVFFGCLVGSQLARAECDLELGLVGEPSLEYDALDQRAGAEQVVIKPFNSGEQECKGFIEFRAIGGRPQLRNSGGAELDYLILSARDTRRQFFDARSNSSTAKSILIPANSSEEFKSVFYVGPNQAARSGEYISDIEVVFVLQKGGPAVAATELRLRVNVAPSVQANFVGVSRTAESAASLLALGEMESHMERSLGLQLRANSDVEVSISSQNGGLLMLDNHQPGDGIDYRLTVDGSSVYLGSAGSSAPIGPLNPNGRTIPINLQVGDIRNVRAGDYADTIFFRISGR